VGKLPFWLKKAIRYAALNIYRQHQRFPMTGCDFSREIDPCAAEPAVGREKAEQTEDQHQQIDRAMATFRFLPKQQRSVVRLRMEGLRNEDIAKKMRLSKSCVGSHLHRARKKIRREIEESPTL